ncbi:reverse transcriptase domain-containing protein [Tanacetum coccineum]
MRTRSSSNLIVESSTIPKRRNHRRSKQIVEPEIRTIVETPVVTMADTRTISELLQAPTEGYEDAIVIPAILAKNFELKVGLLQLLMLFPFSLEGATRIWLEKEPPRSILTWEDLVSKFVNYFFPPSKTTNLKNDITNFQQKFEETFGEAWDRFKELLRKCPHHDFSELHQIDTFYNALTQSNQDPLNVAVGGNLLNRTPRDALTIIQNKSKVRTSRNKSIVSKVSTTTSSSSPSLDVTALTEMCLATDSNTFSASAATGTYNQGGPDYRPQGDPNYRNYQAPFNQAQVGPSNDLLNYMKTNEVNMRDMQNQINNMKTELKKEFQTSMFNQNNEIKNMLSNLFQTQSPSGSGSLPSNTVANPRGDVKAITTQSGISYDGPTIPPTPSPLPKEVKRETEPEVAPKPNTKPSIPYPSRLNDQKLREKANNQMMKFLQIFQRLHFDISFADALLHMPKFASTFKSLLSNKEKLFELANTPLNENCSAVILKKLPKKLRDPDDYDVDPRVPLILGRPFLRMVQALIDVHGEELILRVNYEAITFNVGHTSRYSRNYYDETVHQVNVIDVACEEYAQEVLGFSDSSTRGDFILEEIKACLSNDSIPPGINDADFDPEGDIRLLEKLLNDDPSFPLPPKELNFEELKIIKSFIDDPLELELKDLPSHLEYAFLEGADKLPVIISKELKDEEQAALLKVFKSYKRAIAWKISDIKGIDPRFCTHKILMEDDFNWRGGVSTQRMG